MKQIKLYCRPGEAPLLADFLAGLDTRLAEKLLRQIFRLADTLAPMLKEPHVKRFVIERYSHFYELRERSKICVRLIFTMPKGEILLLAPFIKRQKRDTMQALELSRKMLEDIRSNPALAVSISERKEDFI